MNWHGILRDNRLFDRVLLKFIFVGTINALVGGLIMFMLYNITGIGYWWSSAISYVLTSILSFFLNKYITFSVKHFSIRMIVSFTANILVSYLVAYGIAKPAVKYILSGQTQKVSENVALFVGMCLFTGINYLGQRIVVFKYKQKD